MSDNLPERRRHGYNELEKKLNEHADAIEQRFHKRYRGMLIAFSVIGLACAIALFGFGILLSRQSVQQDKLVKQQKQLARLSSANRDLVFDIQEQRKNSIREICEADNKRNNDTSKAIIKVSQKTIQKAPSEAAREAIRQRIAVTLGLIDSLAPKEDCDKKVKAAVKPVDPKPADPAEGP